MLLQHYITVQQKVDQLQKDFCMVFANVFGTL